MRNFFLLIMAMAAVLLLMWGMVSGTPKIYVGTPACQVFGGNTNNRYADLYCTGVFYSDSGTCTGPPKHETAYERIPPVCGSGSYINQRVECASDSRQAVYGYYCASDNVFRLKIVPGPNCVVLCDPDAKPGCTSPYVIGDPGDCGSPVILDLGGNGFNMTDLVGGVSFDLMVSGLPRQIGWTRPSSDDAWLALDRNGNGEIDNGAELFGDFTQQPMSTEPNGFLALAEFDKLINGGNGDGIIDHNDPIYSALKLWQDRNQNGIAEANEMSSLSSRGVVKIHLDYEVSKYVDQYGNKFRFRAMIETENLRTSTWAYDVFPVKQ